MDGPRNFIRNGNHNAPVDDTGSQTKARERSVEVVLLVNYAFLVYAFF